MADIEARVKEIIVNKLGVDEGQAVDSTVAEGSDRSVALGSGVSVAGGEVGVPTVKINRVSPGLIR